MGNYNPHAPYIIGQEWVPIKNAFYEVDSTTEQGYTFRLDHTVVPVSGAFYVNQPPTGNVGNTCDFISVYPAGRETLTGPIKKTYIPASAVSVGNPGSIDISEGVAALQNQNDIKSITFSPDTGISSQLFVNFNTEAYSQVLYGKRILDVRVRYSMRSFNVGNSDRFFIAIDNPNTFATMTLTQHVEITSTTTTAQMSSISLTDMNPFWNTALNDVRFQRTVLPWRYQELNRFRSGASAADTLVVMIQNNATEYAVALGYMDLEVTYCEETRVLYGGFRTYDTNASNFPVVPTEYYGIGAIAVQLYSPTTFTPGVSLTPGDYTVTIYHRDLSARSIYQGSPIIHAVREFYQLPNQRGIKVNQSLTENDQFTAEANPVLTHLTLHTAATIVTGVHAYGTSAGAPVHTTRTAIQEIEDNPANGAQYPQVRFYARRFGDTTVALTLASQFSSLSLPGVAGSYASTPDNAALDIVGDVDLRADAALTSWASGSSQQLVGKYNTVGNQRSYRLGITGTGLIQMLWSPNGVNDLPLNSTVAVTPDPVTGRLAVRATLDVDNGAGGHTATFYTSSTIDGTWTQLGAPVIGAGTTSIFSGTAVGEAGSRDAGQANLAVGRIYAVEILTGIGGSAVANPRFMDQPAGTTSFVDAAGRTWTINGTAVILGSDSYISISVAEFDALDEITDGWREVNLRFTTPPTFYPTSGDIDWRWQATGELVGNQWQILAASGPSGSWNPVPGAGATGPATYWAPLGSSVALTWQSPTISGAAEDSTTDATLLFSQDPPIVSGFAITQESQELTGIAADACDLPLDCVPTAIDYNLLTWTPFGPFDTFNRESAGSWGTSTSGGSWFTFLDGLGGSVNVTAGRGKSTTTTAGGTNIGLIASPSADTWQRITAYTPQVAAGNVQIIQVFARYNLATNDNYALQVLPNTDGFLIIRFEKTVGGVPSVFGPVVTNVPYVVNEPINIIFGVVGSNFYAKVWIGAVEPGSWTITTTNSELSTVGYVGVRLGVAAGYVTVPITLEIDDYCVTPASLADGAIEIERRDEVATDWQTIMRSTGTCVATFADYEARVGIASEYRIRTVNVLDFYGPWVTGAGTVPDPGVTITGDANSVLIFTSNWAPERNLAYVMQWEGAPVETFAFPEVETLQLQRMFGKNFFTAFHPLERGGERFERVILVNAAATALPSLANITNLREFAWEDLDYICVRDELGNRWFANVAVPSLDVKDDRRIYLAKITVTEVSDTASPVDPGEE